MHWQDRTCPRDSREKAGVSRTVDWAVLKGFSNYERITGCCFASGLYHLLGSSPELKRKRTRGYGAGYRGVRRSTEACKKKDVGSHLETIMRNSHTFRRHRNQPNPKKSVAITTAA